MDKVLVLASGGLDSSVLIALYNSLGYDVHVLYVDYSNKNLCMETNKLLRLLTKLGISHNNYNSTQVKLGWSNSKCIRGNTGNSNYVEMRNLVFLSLAVSCAESLGISKVGIGCIDAFEYVDTSRDFLSNFSITSQSSAGITVEALLKNLSKQRVCNLGEMLGVELKDTYSCNMGDEPCGECQDCSDIKQLVTL